MKSYRDIVGDGGSDVMGQVRGQRAAIEQALAGVDHLVAVGSGKGGVGKSTVTVALAVALNRLGLDVAILDADFNGPTQAQLTGLESAPWVPGDGGLVPPRRADGIAVVSLGSVFGADSPVTFDAVARGDEHVWRSTREFSVLGQLLATVRWSELDVLLIDLPPGADRTTHHADFLGRRAAFVLVTIPSELSRGVVGRSLSALESSRARVLGYVENMAGFRCPDCGTVHPMFPPPKAEPLAAPCLGRLPFDPRIAALCASGWPADEAAATVEPTLAEALLDALAEERR